MEAEERGGNGRIRVGEEKGLVKGTTEWQGHGRGRSRVECRGRC